MPRDILSFFPSRLYGTTQIKTDSCNAQQTELLVGVLARLQPPKLEGCLQLPLEIQPLRAALWRPEQPSVPGIMSAEVSVCAVIIIMSVTPDRVSTYEEKDKATHHIIIFLYV